MTVTVVMNYEKINSYRGIGIIGAVSTATMITELQYSYICGGVGAATKPEVYLLIHSRLSRNFSENGAASGYLPHGFR